MATTVLYLKSSGEVYKISPKGQNFDVGTSEWDAYWGMLTDPTFTDGTEFKDPSTGDRRVLGYSKIAVPLGAPTEVRNATQPEIDGFAAAEAAWEALTDRDGAILKFETNAQWRKLFTAYSDIIKDEINLLRQWVMDYKTEVAAATSLADLQARVAAMADLPDRNLSQLKTQIKNRISEND